MSKRYKKILLLLMLFLAPARANVFSNFLSLLYPILSIGHEVKWLFKTRNQVHDLSCDIASRQAMEHLYPHAIDYIKTECVNAGIQPNLCIVDRPNAQTAVGKLLWYPVHDLEKGLTPAAETQSYAPRFHKLQVTLAHEIGHIVHHDEYKRLCYPVIGWAIATAMGHYFPQPTGAVSTFLGFILSSALKTACAFGVESLLTTLEEYRADSVAIKRFGNEPETLKDVSDFYKNCQINQVRKLLPRVGVLARSTWFWRMHALRFTRHPSHLDRAVRFAQAAGQSITRRQLSGTLYEQAQK